MENMFRIIMMTDSNRNFLEVILTDNLLYTIQDIYSAHQTIFNTTYRLTRIVYEESFVSEAAAKRRLSELQSYPKTFRERLVRRRNPNWLNLYPIKPMASRSAAMASV